MTRPTHIRRYPFGKTVVAVLFIAVAIVVVHNVQSAQGGQSVPSPHATTAPASPGR